MTLPVSEQVTAPLPVLPPSAANRTLRLLLTLLLGVIVLGLAAASATAAGYALYYRDRVLPGVYIADLNLGGLNEREAAAALSARLTSYAALPLTIEAGGERWQIPPRDLGVGYDVAASVQEALRVGRSGTSAERLAAWWPFGRTQRRLQPVGALDQAALLQGLAPALRTLNRPAVDATVQIQPGAGVTIMPAGSGQSLDLTGTTLALQRRAALLSTEPVTLPLRPVMPAVVEGALSAVKDAADALLSQPFTLEATTGQGQRRWSLSAAELSAMLTLAGTDQRTLALDEGRLAAALERLAAEINRPSRAAELRLDAANAPVIAPHEDGLTLDLPASVAAINQAVAQGRHQAALVTRVEPPAVTTSDLEPARDRLNRLLDRQITLSAADLKRTLGRKEIAGFLTFAPRSDAPATIDIVADRAALGDYLAALAKQVDRAARPPVYKYLDGQVTRTAEPVQGRALDVPAAAAALAAGLLTADVAAIALPVKQIDAPLAQVDPSQIVIRDVLAEGVTYYGFSLPERKHNVELATQRLNGTLVPPGELFSFNRAVGRVNTATGYKTGYGIILTNGAVQTVPSVGGGICQVATTVFHAAFQSGVPIGERNWHFYWIPTYGQPPSGMTGLDATVDEDYGLDFTFRNTTGHWLAIETAYDGQNMRVTLKGVNPGWEVRVAGPTISNVKPHDPTPVEREDPTLPAGRRVQVESARDGMDVAITRTVVKDGQVVDQRTFTSHYEPSQNVTLVGTGR
jgi:vancomycin resistance protein YoaR